MSAVKAKTAGPGSQSIENQLREEIKQLTAALDETDQALDEWMAECDKLQKIIKSKDSDLKAAGQQLEELRLHALKLEEERNELRSSSSGKTGASPKASVPKGPSNENVEELRRANEALKEQLTQSQKWVKEGLAKLEQANAAVAEERKRASQMESEKDAALNGQRTTIEQERDKAVAEASRLSAVAHAYELEIASLKAKLATATEDARDYREIAGKAQAVSTAAQFQAECASTDNDTLVNWLKAAVRWSSRL